MQMASIIPTSFKEAFLAISEKLTRLLIHILFCLGMCHTGLIWSSFFFVKKLIKRSNRFHTMFGSGKGHIEYKGLAASLGLKA
jgi:hypothetical protein